MREFTAKILLKSWPAVIGAMGVFLGWIVASALASGQHIEAARGVEKRLNYAESVLTQLQGDMAILPSGDWKKRVLALEEYEHSNVEAHGRLLMGQEALRSGQEAIQRELKTLR